MPFTPQRSRLWHAAIQCKNIIKSTSPYSATVAVVAHYTSNLRSGLQLDSYIWFQAWAM